MPTNILDESVLVLNKGFLALKVCTAKSVLTTLYKGLAKVVDENYNLYTFEEWVDKGNELLKDTNEMEKYSGVLHSPSIKVVVPQAIYLHVSEIKANGFLKVKYSRKNIFHRDDNKCQYCGTEKPRGVLTVDHIIPRSRGGKNTFTNIVAACKECNSKKGDRTPEEAGMILIKNPATPKWKSYTGMPFSKAKKSYWDVFLA